MLKISNETQFQFFPTLPAINFLHFFQPPPPPPAIPTPLEINFLHFFQPPPPPPRLGQRSVRKFLTPELLEKYFFSNSVLQALIGMKTILRCFFECIRCLVILHYVQNSFCQCFQIFYFSKTISYIFDSQFFIDENNIFELKILSEILSEVSRNMSESFFAETFGD